MTLVKGRAPRRSAASPRVGGVYMVSRHAANSFPQCGATLPVEPMTPRRTSVLTGLLHRCVNRWLRSADPTQQQLLQQVQLQEAGGGGRDVCPAAAGVVSPPSVVHSASMAAGAGTAARGRPGGAEGGVIGASAAPVAASTAMPTSEPGLSPCVEELSAGRLGCPAGLDHERAARAAEGSAGPSSGLIARRRKLVISDAGPVSPKKSKTVLSACTLQSANDSAARALDSSRHGGTADPES